MGKRLEAAIAGLGSRGKDTYARAAKLFPDKVEIAAIADLDPAKVREAAGEYQVKEEACFASAEELLAQEKLADVMVIATQDRQHVKHAVLALQKGYHVLLEKPISPDLAECRKLVKTAKECGRQVVVCHVLRYAPFYGKLKELIDSGTIGEIVSVMALENVGWWHQAHSFVRGNWRNSELSSPMILQKCCHDMDILLWLTGKTCKSVSSFGDTYLFRKEKAPEGAGSRCMDGCRVKEDCPFDAEKIYMDHKKYGVRSGNRGWPLDVLTLHPTEESILDALRSGPYGRCVYDCDNNVVDHQVVNLNMTDGSTISLTMCGFTAEISRYTKFMGTGGEIIADMAENTIRITRFGQETETIDVGGMSGDLSRHGGGDDRLMEDFLDMIIEGREPDGRTTSLECSMESHYCAMAAEESRLGDGAVVEIEPMRRVL